MNLEESMLRWTDPFQNIESDQTTKLVKLRSTLACLILLSFKTKLQSVVINK